MFLTQTQIFFIDFFLEPTILILVLFHQNCGLQNFKRHERDWTLHINILYLLFAIGELDREEWWVRYKLHEYLLSRKKNTKNGAAVMSLRTFVRSNDFNMWVYEPNVQ